MFSAAYSAANVDHLSATDNGSSAPISGSNQSGLAQTFPRFVSGANLACLTTQVMFMAAIDVRAPTTISRISFLSGLTGINAATNWWFALYTASRALLAQSADQTSGAWAASTLKTLPLAAAQQVQPGLYYVAVMVKATTVPTLEGVADTTVLSGAAPILHGTADGSLTTTAPSTATTITPTVNNPYAIVS